MTQDFLDGLVGEWTIMAQMGETPLDQQVQARRVLGGHFVELRMQQSEPRYEAIYLLGRDPESGRYVFHLFDSFGVSEHYRFGVADLRSDRLEFTFDYKSGPFHNTLIKHADEDAWTWLLEFAKAGERKVFATKSMARKESSL